MLTRAVLQLGEFRRVLYLAAGTREGIGLQLEHHERPGRDLEWQPNAECLTWDEPEARVVLGVAHDNDDTMPQAARVRESCLTRADPMPAR